jgi:hypothetical protein
LPRLRRGGGAGIGAGTFVAIATGATPVKGAARGLSNRMTARALDVVSRTNGARCCKRDAFLAILAAARFARVADSAIGTMRRSPARRATRYTGSEGAAPPGPLPGPFREA